jgi:hypothetical protein
MFSANDHLVQSVRYHAEKLGHAVLDCMVTIRKIILECYEHPLSSRNMIEWTITMNGNEQNIEQALKDTKNELGQLCAGIKPQHELGNLQELYDVCLSVVSLMEVCY